jgi:ketosteroid isomerase-like protein
LQGKNKLRKLKKMRAMRPIYLIIFSTLLMGCSSQKKQGMQEQELIETDLAFSEMSMEKGMTSAFVAYCAENGVLLRKDAMPVVGRSAIEMLLGKSDDQTFDLTWEPIHARVSASGDLGYTYGLYTIKLKEAGLVSRGTYVSVWTKENGSWKWVLDSGNEGLGD